MDWSKTIAASKAATGRCVGSSVHAPLAGSAKATTSCVTSFAPANASIFPPPTDRIEPARSRLIERRHRLNNRLHLLARALTEPGEYARVAHRSRNRNAARLRRRGARPLRVAGIQR